MSRHPDPELLAAVAAGEPVDDAFAAHLADCAACTADLAALRDLAGRLSGQSPVDWAEPPATLWPQVAAGLDSTREDGGVSRRRWFAVAAAAALGVGAGVAATWWATSSRPTVIASTSLDTLDDRRVLGRAELLQAGTEVELSIRTQPLDPGTGYLEVWLINADGRRMVSVGVLADRTTGLFPVSRELLEAGYRIVDISREAFDDKPAHSGDSLVRGVLPV